MLNNSQNNLYNINLVSKLISLTNITVDDLIVEIGVGKGVITDEILKITHNYIGYELDNHLYIYLKEKYKNIDIRIENSDFLNSELPQEKFKTISNIPFNITADILRKLLLHSSKCTECYLVIQKEAGEKFGGKQINNNIKNSLQSIIYGINYIFEILYSFRRSDFDPIPNVDVIFLKIKKRDIPLINDEDNFSDFCSYIYNNSTPNISRTGLFTDIQFKRFSKELDINKEMKPSELTIESLISMFNVISRTDKKNLYRGHFKTLLLEQEKIEKLHRTR